jgi:hypothetical protein
MPNFARHAGSWAGTYTHIAPDGSRLDHHEVHTVSELPDDGSCDFRLRIHNVWPDGREAHIRHEANYRDGRLWFTGELTGSLWEVDDFTVYLRFGYRKDPSITVCEMIQISDDGRHKARTWHWFKEQKLYKITLTQERRVTEVARAPVLDAGTGLISR